MWKWTSRILIGIFAVSLAFLPRAGFTEEFEIGIAIDAVPIFAEPIAVSTIRIAQLGYGSEVILGEKLCTEREIRFLNHKGYVQDFSIIPITGERAAPEKILAAARFLEERGYDQDLEAAKTLYTAVINYQPGTMVAAKAIERMTRLDEGYESWVMLASRH